MFWALTYRPADVLNKMLIPRFAPCICKAIRAGPGQVLQQSQHTLRQLFVAAPYSVRQGRAAVELSETAPSVQYLEQLDDLVAEARHRPKCSTPRAMRVANELGELPCKGCGKYLCQDAFRLYANRRKSFCKACESLLAQQYRSTLRGNASVLSASARRRMKIKGHPCDLQLDDILDMLVAQGGRCAYSSIPMEILHPHSHWRMSLERKDNLHGYSPRNCLLICAEFNTSDHSRQRGVLPAHVQSTAQWSLAKVCLVSRAAALTVDLQQLSLDIREASATRSRANTKTAKSPWDRTLRGRAMGLASGARRRSAKKGLLCDIDFNDILDMLWQQGGRCFYSGVPLDYQKPHVDWVMSLERLDNLGGYVKGNCVLVAQEFNSADNSRRAAREVRGTAQWSLSKVLQVWGRAGCNLQLKSDHSQKACLSGQMRVGEQVARQDCVCVSGHGYCKAQQTFQVLRCPKQLCRHSA